MSSGVLSQAATAVRHQLGVLPLPKPGEPFAAGSDALSAMPDPGEPRSPDDEVERAHYRWLLGHHVALCVWRRLAEVLARMVRDGVNDAALDEAAMWYGRYSAMFLYAGSCGEPLYRTVVRPSMAAAHPAFSGVWAGDYTLVQQLLRQLCVPADSSLKQAIKTCRFVHMALAKILVPTGESLLKESGRRPSHGTLREDEERFDEFFLVERTAVGEDVFRVHAVRRATAVLSDLQRHPIDVPELVSLGTLLPGGITDVVRDTAMVFGHTYEGVPSRIA